MQSKNKKDEFKSSKWTKFHFMLRKNLARPFDRTRDTQSVFTIYSSDTALAGRFTVTPLSNAQQCSALLSTKQPEDENTGSIFQGIYHLIEFGTNK